jgi:cytochrome c-type biogenesis protein CcsB
MKRLLLKASSLKLAVILLLLLVCGLATGTIVESSQGTDAAGRLVYYSWWFIALECVFALNVLSSIAVHYPWGKARAGFVTTHTALVVILIGASVSWFFKQEGRLEINQGEAAKLDAFPFSIKLDKFTVEHYPGTMRPSNFRSDVEVIDPTGGSFKTAIWMNHELEYKGWRFYQSSYHDTTTILSVSKDPGQPIVFVGYVLLVLGMCAVLATRVALTRAKRANEAALAVKPAGKVAVAAALALFAFTSGAANASPAAGANAGSGSIEEQVRRLPVQHDGRVMPLDTLAREAVLNVTGSHSYDEVEMVLQWTFDPAAGASSPVINLGSRELARLVGLPGETHASFARLASNPELLRALDEVHRLSSEDRPRTGLYAAAEKLEERMLTQQKFLNREEIRPVPTAVVTDRWAAPTATSAAELAALASGPRLAGWPSTEAIDRELLYNELRPTRIAWGVLLCALVLSIFAWSGKRKLLDALSLAGLLGGFAVMTWGIGVRWAIAGRVPASNMYESLLFLGWGVGLFAVIAWVLLRNRMVVLNANAMAALTMALTDLLPIDGFIHPVPPVLSGTPWLAIHVPIIMVSYSVLALGVVIAHMQVAVTIGAPGRSDLIQKMNDLLYWYLHVGSILLVTGIMTGSMWASSSWGRYWGWDPKEVWSLVAFLAYIAILHSRWDKQLGAFGVAAMSIVAFQTILMTYLGVNFVLTTGLHSYGAGESPVVTAMIAVALVEAGFLVWGYLAHRRQQGLVATAA